MFSPVLTDYRPEKSLFWLFLTKNEAISKKTKKTFKIVPKLSKNGRVWFKK
jgi:hypothetical protein